MPGIDEAKKLMVVIGPRGDTQVIIVQLNGVLPNERLTPKLALRAARIAQGVAWGATVWDEDAGIGYRLYRRSARKLKMEV